MTKPILMLVDDADTLAVLEPDVNQRFGAHYRVDVATDPTAALETLRQLARHGDDVALMVAGHPLSQLTPRGARAPREPPET